MNKTINTSDKNLRLVEVSALSVSIVVTVFAMLRASVWKIDLTTFLFLLWAVSPFIFLFLIDAGLRKFAPRLKMPVIFCLTAILMLGLTLLTYLGTLGDESSTYGLLFLFAPVYLYAGAIIFLAAGLIWTLFSKSSKGKSV